MLIEANGGCKSFFTVGGRTDDAAQYNWCKVGAAALGAIAFVAFALGCAGGSDAILENIFSNSLEGAYATIAAGALVTALSILYVVHKSEKVKQFEQDTLELQSYSERYTNANFKILQGHEGVDSVRNKPTGIRSFSDFQIGLRHALIPVLNGAKPEAVLGDANVECKGGQSNDDAEAVISMLDGLLAEYCSGEGSEFGAWDTRITNELKQRDSLSESQREAILDCLLPFSDLSVRRNFSNHLENYTHAYTLWNTVDNPVGQSFNRFMLALESFNMRESREAPYRRWIQQAKEPMELEHD